MDEEDEKEVKEDEEEEDDEDNGKFFLSGRLLGRI